MKPYQCQTCGGCSYYADSVAARDMRCARCDRPRDDEPTPITRLLTVGGVTLAVDDRAARQLEAAARDRERARWVAALTTQAAQLRTKAARADLPMPLEMAARLLDLVRERLAP